MKPSAKIVLDTRRALDTRKFPVKIRVSFTKLIGGEKKIEYAYYPTGESMFKEEFEKLYKSKALAPTLAVILPHLNKALAIVTQKPKITKGEFDYMYNGKGNYESVQGLLDILIAEADHNDQVTTSQLLKATKSSLTNYVIKMAEARGYKGDGVLTIGSITVDFLNDYEKWLVEKGLSYNTIGIYTRYIRSMFNFAVSKGLIGKDLYPFGRRAYVPPATISRKIALTESQKNQLLLYTTNDSKKQKAVDFWVLSYLCFGLNIQDILSLRWRNIEEDMGTKVISIYRSKTYGRKRIKRKMTIPVTDTIQQLINKHCSKSLNPDAYIFDVFEDGLSAKHLDGRKHRFIAKINAKLKEVSAELNLPKVTTYVARHTFAYIMKIKNVPISMVQEMMDHESQTTTENYQGRFEVQDKLTAAKFLYN